jgi:hypothetical protein
MAVLSIPTTKRFQDSTFLSAISHTLLGRGYARKGACKICPTEGRLWESTSRMSFKQEQKMLGVVQEIAKLKNGIREEW